MAAIEIGDTFLGRRRTLTLAAAGVSLIAACYGLARFAYGMFLPAFRDEFGIDAQTAGLIASGSYIAYCLAIVAATLLTPRLGARPVAVAAGLIAALGTALVALAPNPALLAIGVLVAGSSTGIASPPLAHAVAHSVREATRGRTQTVINAGTGFGVAIAGPIALLTVGQWRLAWAAFALLAAAVTLWVAHAVPPRPGGEAIGWSPGDGSTERLRHTSPTDSGTMRRDRAAGPALLPRPALPRGSGRLMVASALMGVASSAIWTFGRDILVGVGGMGQTASAIAWILLGGFGLLGAVAGDAAHRIGLRRAWAAAMLLLAATTVLFAVSPGDVGLAWMLSAVFGAVYIVLTGLLLVWGTEVHGQAPAAGVGLAFLVLALGQAFGSPLIGALITALGPLPAFALAAGSAAIGAVLGPRRS